MSETTSPTSGASSSRPRRPAPSRAEPALVRRDHVEPGIRQWLHLVAPRVRRLGEPVEQDHQRPTGAGAHLDDPHRDAVQLQAPPLHRRRLAALGGSGLPAGVGEEPLLRRCIGIDRQLGLEGALRCSSVKRPWIMS